MLIINVANACVFLNELKYLLNKPWFENYVNKDSIISTIKHITETKKIWLKIKISCKCPLPTIMYFMYIIACVTL